MEPLEYLNFRPTLPVKDLDRAVTFYRDIIGLEVSQLAPEYGLAIMAKQGAMIALFINEAPVSQIAYLYVKGVEVLYATCQEKLVEITQEITTHPYGIRDFVVKDPDGHIIGIGENIAPA